MTTISKVALVTAFLVVLGGVSAIVATRQSGGTSSDAGSRSALIALRSAPANPDDELLDGLLSRTSAEHAHLDVNSVRSVARFRTKSGSEFRVGQGRRLSGEDCLIGVSPHVIGHSCGGLFALGPVALAEAGSGGPDLAARTSYALYGLARPNVARLELHDSLGGTRPIALGPSRAFVFEFAPDELASGIYVREVVAFGRNGDEIGRFPVGPG
jgi:hypothetical protein